MAKLYFLGGENVRNQDAREVNETAFRDAGGSPAVLLVQWARPSLDPNHRRSQKLLSYFEILGARRVDFLDFLEPFEDKTAKVAQADLIYLTGGQTSTLRSRLIKTGVGMLFRNFGGVIIGRSAGALVMGKKCLVTNRYTGAPKIAEGLGLVDFSVKAHYKPDKDEWLKELSRKEKIYAIPMRSAVVFKNGSLSFIGNVFLFEKGRKIVAN